MLPIWTCTKIIWKWYRGTVWVWIRQKICKCIKWTVIIRKSVCNSNISWCSNSNRTAMHHSKHLMQLSKGSKLINIIRTAWLWVIPKANRLLSSLQVVIKFQTTSSQIKEAQLLHQDLMLNNQVNNLITCHNQTARTVSRLLHLSNNNCTANPNTHHLKVLIQTRSKCKGTSQRCFLSLATKCLPRLTRMLVRIRTSTSRGKQVQEWELASRITSNSTIWASKNQISDLNKNFRDFLWRV